MAYLVPGLLELENPPIISLAGIDWRHPIICKTAGYVAYRNGHNWFTLGLHINMQAMVDLKSIFKIIKNRLGFYLRLYFWFLLWTVTSFRIHH